MLQVRLSIILLLIVLWLSYEKHVYKQRYPLHVAKEKVVQKIPDPRTATLTAFFAKYHSPLEKESAAFVTIADTYQLDWRLLPAIAGVESTFETAGNTNDYNPFGFMCTASPCHFENYRSAINKVAITLGRGRNYIAFQHTQKVSDLAEVYNNVSPGEWTAKVQFFMEKLTDVPTATTTALHK